MREVDESRAGLIFRIFRSVNVVGLQLHRLILVVL